MGKALGTVADVGLQVATLGTVGFEDGKFKKGIILDKGEDLLLGKKDPGKADETIDMNTPEGYAVQQRLIDRYADLANQSPDQIAANMSQQRERQILQNVKDNEMRTRQLVAQRGLGGSSVGLGQILGQQRKAAEDIAAVRANQPILQRQLGIENLNAATGGINQILGLQAQNKILKLGREGGQRQGGLAPLIGAGIGGYLGGPAGAQVGMQAGQYASQLG